MTLIPPPPHLHSFSITWSKMTQEEQQSPGVRCIVNAMQSDAEILSSTFLCERGRSLRSGCSSKARPTLLVEGGAAWSRTFARPPRCCSKAPRRHGKCFSADVSPSKIPFPPASQRHRSVASPQSRRLPL